MVLSGGANAHLPLTTLGGNFHVPHCPGYRDFCSAPSLPKLLAQACGSFCVFFAREHLRTEYKTKPRALKAVRGAAEQCRSHAGLDNVARASRCRAWRDAWDFFLVNYRGRFFWASDRRWFPPDEFRFSRSGNRFLYLQTSGCDCAFL